MEEQMERTSQEEKKEYARLKALGLIQERIQEESAYGHREYARLKALGLTEEQIGQSLQNTRVRAFKKRLALAQKKEEEQALTVAVAQEQEQAQEQILARAQERVRRELKERQEQETARVQQEEQVQRAEQAKRKPFVTQMQPNKMSVNILRSQKRMEEMILRMNERKQRMEELSQRLEQAKEQREKTKEQERKPRMEQLEKRKADIHTDQIATRARKSAQYALELPGKQEETRRVIRQMQQERAERTGEDVNEIARQAEESHKAFIEERVAKRYTFRELLEIGRVDNEEELLLQPLQAQAIALEICMN
jgi:hypothetical protein